MQKTTGRILKENEVKVQGQLQLNMKDLKFVPPQGNGTKHNPECKIVEKNQNYALIEVVCACGAKMYLQCDYLNTQPKADDSKKQSPSRTVTANSNQEK